VRWGSVDLPISSNAPNIQVQSPGGFLNGVLADWGVLGEVGDLELGSAEINLLRLGLSFGPFQR
jgi:hypothetical protein